MTDPLAEVVTLLQPGARFSKVIIAAGRWGVRRSAVGQPFYCALLEGSCRLTVDGQPPIILQQGDFVLIPSAYNFTMSSLEPALPEDFAIMPVALQPGIYRRGAENETPDVRLLVGYCTFGSADSALLVSLLPQLVHVRHESRLATIVQLVGEESRDQRPGRDVILAHLLEVLLIEALRSAAGISASPGLLCGLADERLAVAIRRMHESLTRPWTVAQLAKEAALSRSAFFARFSRAVGIAPMEYLLSWRMALAKDLLLRKQESISAIAERVGYGSASAFSVAFSRHVGLSPSRFVREIADVQHSPQS